MEEYYKIAELIYLEFMGQISPEQREILQEWINQSEQHKQYYTRLFGSYSLQQVRELERISVEDGWEKFNQRYVKRSLKIRLLLKYAAVLIVLFSVSLYFYLENTVKDDFLNLGDSNLADVITLTGENGEEKLLGMSRETITLNDGVDLIVDSTGMSCLVDSVQKNVKEPEMQTLRIPARAEFFVTLADGTRVWLNSKTQLRFPSYFSKGKRIVELEGEAYFEVTKDSSKPFIVTTGGLEVLVLGTSFNVKAYPGDKVIETTLVEGSVDVALANGNKKLRLEPGEQCRYGVESQNLTKSVVDPRVYTSWKEGVFAFKNTRLEDMMVDLARWYDLKVVFEDEESKELRFTGEFRRYDDFQLIVKFLLHTHRVRVLTDMSNRKIYIHSL